MKTFYQNISNDFKNNRLVRKEYVLLLALMAFAFVPSINQLIVDRLISGIGGDVLTIAGQIEWFDLFNETILAFLTVPLYFVFNRAKNDDALSRRINSTFVPGTVAYTLISLAIFAYASTLASYMSAPAESVTYLRLETIGFVAGFIGSFMYVVFVVRGRYEYVVALLVAKVAMLSVGNLLLIPEFDVTGVAVTNILVNTAISAVSVILLRREGLIRHWSGLDKEAIRDWARTGLFSGGQVLIANLVYMLVIVKMINDVSDVGSYWLANNFIWGWLLIPLMAIGEMVKREYFNGYRRVWNYLGLSGLAVIAWLISIPLWGPMFSAVIGAEDPDAILDILYKLVPFYVPYAASVVLQGVLVSVGRTDYLLCEAAIVNGVYYGILYGLYLMGFFEADMDFVILLFGFGMVACLLLDVVFYLRSRRFVPDKCPQDGSSY